MALGTSMGHRWAASLLGAAWIVLAGSAWILPNPVACAAEAAVQEVPRLSQVIRFTGILEYAPAGTNQWLRVPTQTAGVVHYLAPGDRVRTPKDGSATIQLSDRSVVQIGPSSVVEIQSPQAPSALRRLRLLRGLLFFLNREKPSTIEIETPLVTGAIRGTEFVLSAAEVDGSTDLALLDGEVLLNAGGESMAVRAGQRVSVAPGGKPILAQAPADRRLVQWALYYPAILDPAGLEFSGRELDSLAPSIAAYREGDVRAALRLLPEGFIPDSISGTSYVLAVRMAGGEMDHARRALKALEGTAPGMALTEWLGAITFESESTEREPMDATGWMARSYSEQSQGDLRRALEAARAAVRLSPGFGLGWARVAELELGVGERRNALVSLDKAQTFSPKLGVISVVEGFDALDRGQPKKAMEAFDRARVLDDSNGLAWLGRGLAKADLGDLDGAAADLQVAGVLEPQRALHRSAQAKVRGQRGEVDLARKDLRVARQLDAADPTPWLYEALIEHRENRINDAVRDLEQSVDLNDGRRLYRSRLLLDRDRAVRNVDLARVYQDAGLDEVARLAAGRAVEEDLVNPSAHLFLSRSYLPLENLSAFDLRYGVSRQSELLVANLLAPRGGGQLSSWLSESALRSFVGPKPISLMSMTEYRSQGDWSEWASVYGQLGGLGYSLDTQILRKNGNQPNGWLDHSEISLQLKQELGDSDSVYLQVSDRHVRSGDIARLYDPNDAREGLRIRERQEPNLYAGWHHEWSPQSHTLLLVSQIQDQFNAVLPNDTLLLVRNQFGGPPRQIQTDSRPTVELDSDYTLRSAELQHLWQAEKFGLIAGGRFQSGDVGSRGSVWYNGDLLSDVEQQGSMERADVYALGHWNVLESLRLSAGLAYERISFPSNLDQPPLDEGTSERSSVVPRAGLRWDVWKGGAVRGSFSQSLGGLYFDDAVRLQPVQLAGFLQTYRSLAPESSVAVVPGTEFQTIGLGFDQKLGAGTYLGIAAEDLRSEGDRQIGAMASTAGLPLADSTTQLRQTVDFGERRLSIYASQLIGSRWSVGARYQISEASLDTRLPSLPRNLPGLDSVEDRQRATLGNLELFARIYHECGFFAGWQTHWRHQDNRGFAPARVPEDFWQHDITVGYRFFQRRAEASVSVLNLTGQDFRLNPLNYIIEPPRERTVVVRLKWVF